MITEPVDDATLAAIAAAQDDLAGGPGGSAPRLCFVECWRSPCFDGVGPWVRLWFWVVGRVRGV